MINYIKLLRLRNGEFVQFFQTLTEFIQQSNPAALNIEQQYNTIAQLQATLSNNYAKQRKSDLTALIAIEDKRRDNALQGIIFNIRSYTYHFSPSIQNAALILIKYIKRFGKSMTRQNYATVTSNISSIISHFENDEKYIDAISKLNLEGWLLELKTANNAFQHLYIKRLEEKAETPSIKTANLRADITLAYKKILKHIAANAVIHPTESILHLIKQINALIDKYNTLVNTRKHILPQQEEEIALNKSNDVFEKPTAN